MVFTPWSSHHAGAHGVVTTPHAGSDQMMQSTKPSGATSSPAAQGGTRRILEDAVRARGVVCVRVQSLFELTNSKPTKLAL